MTKYRTSRHGPYPAAKYRRLKESATSSFQSRVRKSCRVPSKRCRSARRHWLNTSAARVASMTSSRTTRIRTGAQLPFGRTGSRSARCSRACSFPRGQAAKPRTSTRSRSLVRIANRMQRPRSYNPARPQSFPRIPRLSAQPGQRAVASMRESLSFVSRLKSQTSVRSVSEQVFASARSCRNAFCQSYCGI